MVPESTRLTVDMLCQILLAPIIDVGKQCAVLIVLLITPYLSL
jgi:hypothetical protein